MLDEKTKKEMGEIFDNLSQENSDRFMELLRFTYKGEEAMRKKMTHSSTIKHQSSVVGE
nr:MAG TPA: hypothetical protein [Caudoviricetes sp.]